MKPNTELVTCPVCGDSRLLAVVELRQLPRHCNLLWPTRTAALAAPRGDLRLVWCRRCGHLFNRAFEPQTMSYSQCYENSLHFSPHFRRYADELARSLAIRYALRGKTIVEIGCGQGEFLARLCELGECFGLGFDPGYTPTRAGRAATSERLHIVADVYNHEHVDVAVALICCRHVLEHIADPYAFVAGTRRMEGGCVTPVFFEVPNALFTLRDLGIWDLIYEHVSYFSPCSLRTLFTRCSFRISRLHETYAGQFLCLEALPARAASLCEEVVPDELEQVQAYVMDFADKYRRQVARWRGRLARLAHQRRRVVAWGSGSKGVTFLNVLRAGNPVEYIVDINPHKHGLFVAGSGQEIVAPTFLQHYRPEVVLVMNPIYRAEIARTLKQLDVESELIDVQTEASR